MSLAFRQASAALSLKFGAHVARVIRPTVPTHVYHSARRMFPGGGHRLSAVHVQNQNDCAGIMSAGRITYVYHTAQRLRMLSAVRRQLSAICVDSRTLGARGM